MSEHFLGVVTNGKFQQLMPDPDSTAGKRFTSIEPQQSVLPKDRELKFDEYEGSAIMIQGHDHGDWVYSAEVIDKAGPILTAVVQRIFGQASYK
jgi:hypothetical protein